MVPGLSRASPPSSLMFEAKPTGIARVLREGQGSGSGEVWDAGSIPSAISLC